MTMATISPTGKTLFKDLVLVKSPASICASGGRRLKGHMQVKTCENVLVAFNALSQCPKRNRLHHEGTNRWDSIHNVTLPAKLTTCDPDEIPKFWGHMMTKAGGRLPGDQ